MGKLANIPGAAIAIKINAAHRAAFGNAKKAMEYAAECGQLLLERRRLPRIGCRKRLQGLGVHHDR